MLRSKLVMMVACAAATAGFADAGAAAGEFGTAAEAKAMLERAVAAVRQDKAAAIASFNRNDSSFRDRDLFVFCFNAGDGKFTAHEALVDWDVRRLRDAAGSTLGAEMYARNGDSGITEITYTAPRPGSTQSAEKRAYLVHVDDQVCGVSAYQASGRPGKMTQ